MTVTYWIKQCINHKEDWSEVYSVQKECILFSRNFSRGNLARKAVRLPHTLPSLGAREERRWVSGAAGSSGLQRILVKIRLYYVYSYTHFHVFINYLFETSCNHFHHYREWFPTLPQPSPKFSKCLPKETTDSKVLLGLWYNHRAR